ncbi:MAG: phenylalanine--tRNA ligase subunit beta [Candidatus Diapherotrites archaeon CG08_land_8_20_14_0_20_30_16]|nr:MAG: phenylalanine--tRNA ligase subunit beta [Candidatus Diapherotrites archaeon CG08_land_8_20_14_0_20_30_16]
MPNIVFSKRDLESLMGFDIDNNQLETYFFPAKGELNDFVDGVITVEITDSNRPDLWSVEGIARELKAHLGLEKALPKYRFAKSDYIVEVSGENKFNPKETSAIIRNVNVTEDLLISMINFQEKLCNTFGRKRSEFAIGIYALNKVNGKRLRYTVVDKKTKFKPLEFNEEMTLEEILKVHPKGKEFAHLMKDMNKYPVWIDEAGKIMSMPPIINSNESGKVELGLQDLFLEVTGVSQEKVDLVLLICALAFADRGAKVESITVNYLDEKKAIVSLDTTPGEISFEKQKIFDYLGEFLTDNQIVEFLERKHYNIKVVGNKVNVQYPKYRQDILHPVDIIEDLIIEYGYNVIKPAKFSSATTGKILQTTEWSNLVREASIGLGLQEVVTFTLTNVKKQSDLLNIDKKERPFVELANPMSGSIAIFRQRILPEHLELLSKNQHISYPQNIFEFGKSVHIELKNKNEIVKEENNLCVTLCHNEASYTEAKQRLDAILKAIDAKDIKYEPVDLSYLISKRSALVTFKLGKNICTGYIGELHPDILLMFGLNMPVAYFEICVDKY